MRFEKSLKSISKKIFVQNDSLFSYPVKKQKKYLYSLPEPESDMERSYAQYKCQMKMMSPFVRVMSNFVFAVFFVLMLCRLKNCKKNDTNYDAICFIVYDGVVPESLLNTYKKRIYLDECEENFDKEDRKIILGLWKKYPFSFLFLFKCLLKMEKYSALIRCYSPKAIIVSDEFSYTSSFLTYYCEQHDVKHINVMHGDKLFYMRDSFFRYSQCYVWDKFYIDLFAKLRAAKGQFIVSLPPALCFDKSVMNKSIDYTFYLDTEEEKDIAKMNLYWEQLINSGYVVAVRPHPRYSSSGVLNACISSVIIENSQDITIQESILRTRHVVSLCSTVLFQALCNGVDIVIDNLTYPEKYIMLKDLEFICLNKSYKVLSDLVGDRSNG